MPDPADMPTDSQAYRDYVARCQAKHVNHGRHTSRCRQGRHRGNDDDCGEGFSLPYPERCDTDPTYDRDRQVILMPRNRGKIIMHSRAVLLAFNCNNNVFFSGVHNVRLPRHRKSKVEPGMSTTPPAAESMPPTTITSSDDDDTADAAPTKDKRISTADTPPVFETITEDVRNIECYNSFYGSKHRRNVNALSHLCILIAIPFRLLVKYPLTRLQYRR
jgi:hypothetical protein